MASAPSFGIGGDDQLLISAIEKINGQFVLNGRRRPMVLVFSCDQSRAEVDYLNRISQFTNKLQGNSMPGILKISF